MVVPKKYLPRKEEIFQQYMHTLDCHLQDVLNGKADDMYELRDIAKEMHIHPTHLSNVIKAHTGKHPCHFYELKILKIAKDLLQDGNYTIADVAHILTYDPSNFTKWFKAFTGMTPSQYRKAFSAGTLEEKTEVLTI